MPGEIQGVLPIVHTPFDEDDRIDPISLAREIDWAFSQGADGICTGMVSELLRLTSDERLALAPRLVELAAGRGPVIASVGAESTPQALIFARSAEQSGCGAIMAIPPTTTALGERELTAYFSALAEAVEMPLIVQDASGYVGRTIPLAVQVGLVERYGPDKILFKPEAAPVGPHVSALRDATGGAARVFDGSGGIALVDCYRRGLAGTMPGMEMLDAIVALWRALGRGDEAAIYRWYLPVCALAALEMQAGLDGFLAIEKYLLVRRGIFRSDRRRQPNGWSLDDETAREVDRLFEQLSAVRAD